MRNGSNSAWITIGVLDPAGFQVGGITPIANGGTGAITAALALAALLPSQTGNAGKALVTDATTATWTTINGITSGTAVASTSGTAINFINIPASVKRVTVMFNGVSTSGVSALLVQLGTSSGFVASGYASRVFAVTTNTLGSTAGFVINDASAAAAIHYGSISIQNVSSNTFVCNGIVTDTATPSTFRIAGGVTLPATLDRIRITTVNGTDTFDAGSINILYEG
jgi:hypothetical protein